MGRAVSLPGGGFREGLVEGFDEVRLVGSRVGAVEESIQGLGMELLPASFLLSGENGVEKGAIGFGGFEVAGGVTDHEDVRGGVFPDGGEPEVLGFCPHFLAGDHLDEAIESMFRPLPLEGVGWGLGDAHGIGSLLDSGQGFADAREGGDAVDDVCDGGVDAIGPRLDGGEGGVATLHFGVEGGVSEFGLTVDPLIDGVGVRDGHTAGGGLWSGAEEVEGAGEGGEAVGAAGFGVEVDKFPNLAGVFADGLEAEVFDEHRREALLVLDLHGIEDAAVGVDADEEVVGWTVVAEDLGWVLGGHGMGRGSGEGAGASCELEEGDHASFQLLGGEVENLVEGQCIDDLMSVDGDAAEGFEVGAAADLLTEFVGEAPDVGALGAGDAERAYGFLVAGKAEGIDVDESGFAFDFHTLAGEFVEGDAVLFHGGDHWGGLEDVPDEPCGVLVDLFERDRWDRQGGGDPAGGIIAVRGGAESDGSLVDLVRGHELLGEAGGFAEDEDEESGGGWIESSAVADLLEPESSSDGIHHIMGGGAGRLVDEECTVEGIESRQAHAVCVEFLEG